MTNPKEAKKGKIPTFKTIEEEAAFWDSHSIADYQDELEEVEVRFARPLLKQGITIRFEEETLAKLRSIAREKGIGPTTLARILVLERLQEIERERPAR